MTTARTLSSRVADGPGRAPARRRPRLVGAPLAQPPGPRRRRHVAAGEERRRSRSAATPVKPGLFVPAAVALYARLLEIHKLNADLMAHFASYALVETDWRDLKVACAALMLVQTRAGEPIHDDDGTVAFYDDDYRRIGEAMVLWYQKKSSAHADAEGGAARRRAARDAGDRGAQPRGGLRRPGREARAARSLAEGRGEVARGPRDEPRDAAGPRQGRLQGDDQEPRAQGRLQAGLAGVLRDPRLEAEAGRRRSPRGRSRRPRAREGGALRRAVARRRSARRSSRSGSATRTSSAGCRRTSASRRRSWSRCCRRCRTATCAS